MTQVNGLPDERREIINLQDSSQTPAISDESEVNIFEDEIVDENLPYLPINGEEEPATFSIMLDEVVVTAKAPPKKPLFVPTNLEVNLPDSIDLKANMRMSASDLVERYGGKFQKREVNGLKQQIVIVNLSNKQYKFAVNEDGFIGEELVTISTFGKNKYITKSEHERRMEEIFHGPVPEGVDVEYSYENGTAYPVFKKDGKPLSSKDLRALITKTDDDEDISINEEADTTLVNENVDTSLSESERRQNIYSSSLVSKSLTNSSGENLITPEIIALFNEGETDINYSDLLDEAGNIKSEFKLFDLNGDGQLDDREKAFFSSGGRVASEQTVNLSIDKFIQAVTVLDSFDLNEAGYNFSDGKIANESPVTLYSMLKASQRLLDKLGYLPEEVQQKYSDALKQISLYSVNSSEDVSIGKYAYGRIGVNLSKIKSIQTLEYVLLHELTHHILSNDLQMSSDIVQEVEAFYMQYRLYCANKKKHPNSTRLLENSTISVYAQYADELKEENPDISEKELALKSFLKVYFDKYKEQYSTKISKRNFSKQVNSANYLYLK